MVGFNKAPIIVRKSILAPIESVWKKKSFYITRRTTKTLNYVSHHRHFSRFYVSIFSPPSTCQTLPIQSLRLIYAIYGLNCPILSECSNFVRIVQFCPICPILFELSNFIRIVQVCPKCPILFELYNFVQIVQQFCPIMSELSDFVRTARANRLKISILFKDQSKHD